jgi:cellulose biosynthesis protein BcsQ
VKVIATYSIKGGVGKTTTAVNLAHEAALTGVRVLVWDLDPQGAATYLLRVRQRVRGGSKRLVRKGELADHIRGSALSPVHVVPADFSLRHLDLHLDAVKRPTQRLAMLLEPVADRYDLAILDCPPGITLTSEAVIGAADALIVPVVPATLASRMLGRLRDFLAERPGSPPIIPVLSMVERRRALHRDLAVALAEEWPALLATAVPSAAAIERMGDERAPVGAYAPRTAAATAYRRLWAEVASVLWPPGDTD